MSVNALVGWEMEGSIEKCKGFEADSGVARFISRLVDC